MQTTKPLTADAIEPRSDGLVIILGERKVHIPWASCSAKLAAADDQQRRRAELSPGGYGIHWPELDEDLAVDPLVRKNGS